MPTVTPTLAATATPAPIPGASDAPSSHAEATIDGWPVAGAALPVFGPDGRLYTMVGTGDGPRQLVALDAHGTLQPGWPFPFGGATPVGYRVPVVGGDGWVYVTACGSKGPCGLHRISSRGHETAPWPIALVGATGCSAPVVGPDGTVYATCSSGLTIAVDPNAGVKRGWPVRTGGDGLLAASDGTVYIYASVADTNAASPDATLASVIALAPDGTRRTGWPVRLPGGLALFDLASDGTLYTGWYEGFSEGEGGWSARRTVYTAISRDGRTLPGWPRGAVGASSATLGPDGTLYYASQAGNVYAHDRAGRIKRGWPVRGVGTQSLVGSPLYISPLGPIVLLSDTAVTALAPDGRLLAGWPWAPDQPGSLSWCWQATPCAGDTYEPAIEPDGTVYVIDFRMTDDPGTLASEIVAIDRHGQTKPGWPQPTSASSLTVGPDGTVYASSYDGALSALRPDGTPVE